MSEQLRRGGLAFLRTTAFRQTLLSAALFAFSSLLILAFVYAFSVGASVRRADAAVLEEIEAVQARLRAGGVEAANRYVLQRTTAGAGDYLYLLVHPAGRRMSGNLSALPAVQPDGEDRIEFQYGRPVADGAETGSDTRRARGRIVDLPGGHRLLVGVDVEEEERLVARLLNAVLFASGLALALGVAAGALVSRRFVRRLDTINAVARDVKAGDLKHRAPRNYSGDELDELSANFNAMLDRVEQLMARMKTVGDSIAHDLRSPLTRMRNRLESALREEGGLKAREAALNQAVSDADELLGVFNAVLSISRIEAGERREVLQEMDPAPVTADLAELYDPVCEEAGLDFSYEAEAGAKILGDRGLLSQALANLLDNAVKYTPKGGAVALRLRTRASGEVEISVTDTGPGVPEADRARITQRFVRLEQSRTQPGSGLGLSLVQAVADLHDARLELSDGPGVVDGRGPGLRAALVFAKMK